jgi:hypothetical protein
VVNGVLHVILASVGELAEKSITATNAIQKTTSSQFLSLLDYINRSLLMCYHASFMATVHDLGILSLVILLDRIIFASSAFWSCFSIESWKHGWPSGAPSVSSPYCAIFENL